MSRKRESDMKGAFNALKVGEPLRLPKSGPTFKAPALGEQKEVPQIEASLNEVSRREVPPIEAVESRQVIESDRVSPAIQNGAPQIEATPKGVPLREAPPSAVTHKELPRKEVAHRDQARTEPPQIEGTPSGHSHNEQPESELPRFDPAQAEDPEDRPSDLAFFKLSHRVFSEPGLQKLSGDCFRLFLWMAAKAWRYPNSEGTVRASVRYIEEGTGMSHANVSRCLKSLKEIDLVRLVHTDFKRGNVWWISPIACPAGGPGGRGIPKNEVPQKEVPLTGVGAASKSGGSYPKMRSELPHSEGEIKKLRNKKIFKEARQVSIVSPLVVDQGPSEGDYEDAISQFEEFEDEERRKCLVKEFVERELSHGFLPPARVLKRMVAYDWFRKQRDFRSPSNFGLEPRLNSACA